ncbi:MAG: bifunctional diguanylate cyclase/phosphodiesterase, partial [Herbinix sp.]|nr:bifunctional diguanylate cyclase/phosphodiesterase [Herbinix sp.]
NLYRLGGDEFVIIINDRGQEGADEYAANILAGLKEPFKLGDSMLHINISIGASIYPDQGRDANELLRCADIAMYKAKEAGGNRYMLYMPSMNDIILERMLIEKYLHLALEKNELELYYQPQFDLIENRITGFEALLRWNSRELGAVSPIKFIKIAEETHLIIPLGTWVMKEACAFMKKLQEQGKFDITIAVNISILQILQDNFIDFIFGVLGFYNLEPQNLELEITETILMESFEVITDKLNLLNGKGIKIALDDFGKGYSSLSYLKQLPITTLKIDKSFIDYISTEQRNRSLTGQIVKIGKSMGLSVVAEGVETKEQLDYLILNHCQKIQGYLFSKPLPESEVWHLLS